MIQAIAYQMVEGIGNFFDESLVEFGTLTDGLQLDLLVQLAREIANDAREAAEDEGDRHHPDRHDRLLQVARVVLQLSQRRA